MSRLETINKILKVIISIFLTLILSELVLTYYGFISIKSSIISSEIVFGIILLLGSMIFCAVFRSRKVIEVLKIESINKRPFTEPYSLKQVGIWKDISSNIVQEAKKIVPFGTVFSYSPANLENIFKSLMTYIDERLNTTYKDTVEDEISGKDAILLAVKKTYENDLRDYYYENIFDKNKNWEKYGKSLRSDPITDTTNFEQNEKRQARVYSGLKKTGVAVFFIACIFNIICESLESSEK